MNILGVDPGYSLGYAVVNPSGVVISGVFRPKGKTHDKLSSIYRFVRNLIAKHSVSLLAIERAFYGKSVPSLVKLSEARGAVLAAAGEFHLDVKEIHPSEAKKWVCGYGSADKEQVIYMVSKIFGVEVESHHEADALALAYTALSLVEAGR